MSLFTISQYRTFAVTFFVLYINYAHSYLNVYVPGKSFEDCFLFLRVTQNSRSAEHLGLADNDLKCICVIKNTAGNSLCFVVSTPNDGRIESVCHEFDLPDLHITRFTYPSKSLDIVVFRNGSIRWHLHCKVLDYDHVKQFYSMMKYNSPERNLRGVEGTINLRKKTGLTSDYEVLATRPSIYIDESEAGGNIIHIGDSRPDGNVGPLVIMQQKEFNIYTPEEDKVYMSLREYPSDLYFFTCASRNDANRISNDLGQYSHDGRAVYRTNPVLFLF